MNPLTTSSKCLLRTLAVLVAAGILVFALGCGSGGNNGGGGGGGNQGFTNASLNGTYAFTWRGVGLLPGSSSQADFFVEGGVFTADGNGRITAGNDDFVQGGIAFNDPFTGTYTVNKDGSGNFIMDFGTGGSTRFRFTLIDTAHLYVAEDDSFRTSFGIAEKQTQTTMPADTFIVRAHDSGAVQNSVSTATMARVTLTGANITGNYYQVDASSVLSGSVTGSVGTPTDGRGTFDYSLDGVAHGFFYYVVGPSKFLLLEHTPSTVAIGQAEAQSGITFSNSSLSGSYAFGSSGETAFLNGVNTVGAFTTDGAGNVLDGSFDSVEDGVVSGNIPVSSGTYSITGNGFGNYTLGTDDHAIWMVSPSRAFFIALRGTNIEDGTLDKQTGTFSNSNWNKQSAVVMDGFDGIFKDRVGTLTPDGSGNVRTNYRSSFFDQNTFLGGSQDNAFTGAYAVDNTGRGTAQFSGFTNAMVLYFVSNNSGYVLQADPGVNISGSFGQQTGP